MALKIVSFQAFSVIDRNDRQLCVLKTTADVIQRVQLKITAGNRVLACKTVTVDSGEYEQTLLLEPVTTDTDVCVSLALPTGEPADSFAYRWCKPRTWTIYVMVSSHTDIGLHNSQYIQRYESEKILDKAVALCDATADRPVNDRYRYTVEGSWFWENYPMDRGMDAAMRLVNEYVKPGKIGVCAGIAGNLTQSFGFYEVCRSAYVRRHLSDTYGIDSRTMAMIDINGLSWGLVAPYADAGYEHIMFFPNQWNPFPSTVWYNDKSKQGFVFNPDAGGGASRIDVRYGSPLPMLFYWQSAQGNKKLLVWTTPHYKYGGAVFGFLPDARANDNQMGAMLGKVMQQLPKMEARYPYDIWLTSSYWDDQEPDISLTDTFAMWNAQWKYPIFRTLGNPDEPFDIVKEKYGDAIPTLRGEITGGWYQAPLAASDVLSQKLNTDRRLATAETVCAVASMHCKDYRYPAQAFERAWNGLMWHDEHSYGMSGYKGRRVYETWMQHRDWIEKAQSCAAAETANAMKTLARQYDGQGIFIFNPSSHDRKDRITLDNKQAIVSVPACSYTVIGTEQFEADSEPMTPCVTPPTVENEYYRIVFAADGAIARIFDKELQRDLLEENGGANRFLYTQDNHQTFHSVPEATFIVCRTKTQTEVRITCDEPASGAHLEITVVLYDWKKQIDITNKIEHLRDMVNDKRYYRFLYYAFPFAVPGARRFCMLNGCEAEYAVDLTGHGTDTYMQTHEWCCAENDSFGVALFQRDTGVTEFDHIHPDKTDVGNVGDGSSMYVYVANDWLQSHVTGGSYLSLTLRFGITSYAGNRHDAGIARMAEDFVTDLLCLPFRHGANAVSCSPVPFLCVNDGRLLGVKRSLDGEGWVAHVLSDKNDVAVSMNGTQARRVTPDEREGASADTVGYTAWYLPAGQTVPMKEADGPYTGLITSPRAFTGEGEGHMYVLWGAAQSPDVVKYEIYRSEQPGFVPGGDTFVSDVPLECYCVARYEDTGLKPHTAYYYRVCSVTADGKRTWIENEFAGITAEEYRNR